MPVLIVGRVSGKSSGNPIAGAILLIHRQGLTIILKKSWVGLQVFSKNSLDRAIEGQKVVCIKSKGWKGYFFAWWLFLPERKGCFYHTGIFDIALWG